MPIIRTFHPVGQGAFYSEKHNITEAKEVNVVYDCGSSTLSSKLMMKYVKASFTKNTEIDILFISHFHADHINGIEYLHKHTKIKTVVMPLLDDQDKVLYKISNVLGYSFFDTRLLDDPQGFFGENVKIYFVKQFVSLDIPSNASNFQIIIEDINDLLPEEVESGVQFIFQNKKEPYWKYVPYNFLHDERSQIFIDELNKNGLSNYKELLDIQNIFKYKSIIQKSYEVVDDDLNKTSLALFSTSIKCNFMLHDAKITKSRTGYAKIIGYGGCLFLGDIDLNQKGSHGNKNLLEILTDLLSKEFVGTIQIPHHGSIKSYKNGIIDKKLKSAVISYGNNNTFGHPSSYVMGDIRASSMFTDIVHVTEYSNTCHIQVIIGIEKSGGGAYDLRILRSDTEVLNLFEKWRFVNIDLF